MRTILALLLTCSICFGQALIGHRDTAFIALQTPPSGACSTPDYGDEMDEGFQTATTGYELSSDWSETGTTANIDPAFDISALTSGYTTNGMCSQGWKLDVPTDGTETYATYDHGSSIEVNTSSIDCDITFFLYPDTFPDDPEEFRILSVGNGSPTSSVVAYVMMQRTGAIMRIYATGSDVSSKINIGEDQWYKVVLHLDGTAADSSIAVDDGTPQTFTRLSNDVRYIGIGAPSNLESGDSGLLYFDLININTP